MASVELRSPPNMRNKKQNPMKSHAPADVTNVPKQMTQGDLCAASMVFFFVQRVLPKMFFVVETLPSIDTFVVSVGCLELPRSMVVSVLIRRPLFPRSTPFRCVCRLRVFCNQSIQAS